MSFSVPQTSPKASYLAYQERIDAAIAQILDSGWYILGKHVATFEQAFASYLGATRAVGVANGTDALHLALRACGVGHGDAVITVSHTAVATVAAIEMAGATPILVDIDPTTYTIDLNHVEDMLRSADYHPKAIIPVHLYGHPVDMPALLDIAQRYDLYVIEDCAQAHGATLRGKKMGVWGHIAAFSFYPTKNLGALGDGGLVATDDEQLAERVRSLREYGWLERYVSHAPGFNSRLDEIQAAVLQVKLCYLDQENERRRTIAQAYDTLLADTTLVLPQVCSDAAGHVYHQYVVRLPQRDDLKEYLRQREVGTLVHYPVPVHLQPAYRERLLHTGSLRQTEKIARQVLSLPMFPQLSDAQVQYVSELIVNWQDQKS